MLRGLQRRAPLALTCRVHGRSSSTFTAQNASRVFVHHKPRIVISVNKSSDNGGSSGSNNDGNGNGNYDLVMKLINYAFGASMLYQIYRAANRPRVQYHTARIDHVGAIVEVTNEAFMADAFFKKPEYHKRFTQAEVMDMLNTENAVFLLGVLPKSVIKEAPKGGVAAVKASATSPKSSSGATSGGGDKSYSGDFHSDFTPDDSSPEFRSDGFAEQDNATYKPDRGAVDLSYDKDHLVCASVYLSWHTDLDADGAPTLTGKISAVSVPPKWSHRGIGKKMIKKAEEHLLQVAARELGSYGQERAVVMEMGVINVREDLFRWYEKQGYRTAERMPHDDELDRIIAPHMKDKVYCVRMVKVLKEK